MIKKSKTTPAMLLAVLIAAVVLVSPRQPPVAVAVAAAAAVTTCKQDCGGVEITYPFGIGRGCFLETGDIKEPFNVTCSSNRATTAADGGPQPERIPMVDGLQLVGIDVPGARIRVNSWVSKLCYNASSPTKANKDDTGRGYESTTFRVSDTENVLTAVGCDVMAYIEMTQEGSVEDDPSFVVGCSATCPRGVPSSSMLANAAGSGGGGGGGSPCNGTDGCCQTPVRPGIRSFMPRFVDNSDDDRPAGGPCRYVFLVEKKSFEFRTSFVTDGQLAGGAAGKQLPLVLDWAVGNKSCLVAQKDNATYACRSSNHQCVDAKNGPGYVCKCKDGYRGNPYVKNGCEYVNICKVMNPCHASAKCDSTEEIIDPCSCPRGRRFKGGRSSGECEIDYLLPVIGTSVVVVVLAVVTSCTHAVQERKRRAAMKQSYFRQHGGLVLFGEMKLRQGQQQGPLFTLFTKKELEQATDSFDERHVLGKGGNGTVYRGDLRDGRAVAIKRCRVADDERQRREFGTEVLILSQVNHRNIVKLYGCCLEVEVPMLVYQFIPNGTLHQLLHGDVGVGGVGVRPPPPPFSVRLKIAHEAAEALAYLHSTASPPIIHGDVKSANILLDENYTAKVSDFGASVLAPSDEAHLVTLVQGTCGYLDPEYMQTCRLTDRSDVYSFGVVLLELLTRRKALTLAAPPGEERSLAAHFLSAMRDGRLGELLDAWIKGEASGEVLEMVATLAKRCLEISGEKRPSMREVAEELDRIKKLLRQGSFGEVAIPVRSSC